MVWRISIVTCTQITHCSILLPIEQRFGICRGQRASQAHMGQRFPVAGIWWLRPSLALVATADFNSDGRPDYLLYNPATRQTAIWYLNNNVYVSSAFGPTLPAAWSLVGQ